MCIKSVFSWVEAAKLQSIVRAKNSISNRLRKNANFSSKMQYLIKLTTQQFLGYLGLIIPGNMS
jgi:hypothetical protein